ncbi:MAG: hypothetical protein HY738_05325 [Bacteroidia bacterium]|nr:hypothetical protein [Bacteroidia bacterium]
MKKQGIILFILISGYLIPSSGQGLNGIYNINGTGSYPTFTSAVDSLITYGVSGPVVFIVKEGI